MFAGVPRCSNPSGSAFHQPQETETLAYDFDRARWEVERKARADRKELRQAQSDVLAGRIGRYTKPGYWVVFRDDSGRTLTEVFP